MLAKKAKKDGGREGKPTIVTGIKAVVIFDLACL